MDNIGNMLGLSNNATKEERKQALMSTIAQQSNIENARTLIEKINEKCFEKCVPKPGTSLSSGESTCLTTCMQKYMQAWNAVSQAYISRIKSDPRGN
jgi:import inner membrane translocase subunit TIM13